MTLGRLAIILMIFVGSSPVAAQPAQSFDSCWRGNIREYLQTFKNAAPTEVAHGVVSLCDRQMEQEAYRDAERLVKLTDRSSPLEKMQFEVLAASIRLNLRNRGIDSADHAVLTARLSGG
jgi:hypothetical protein